MKRNLNLTVALVAGLGLAGAAIAQGRHDERPHGYNQAKVAAAAKAKIPQPSSTGGRHDEKPHGVAKAATTSKATGPKSPAKPGAETEAVQADK